MTKTSYFLEQLKYTENSTCRLTAAAAALTLHDFQTHYK